MNGCSSPPLAQSHHIQSQIKTNSTFPPPHSFAGGTMNSLLLFLLRWNPQVLGHWTTSPALLILRQCIIVLFSVKLSCRGWPRTAILLTLPPVLPEITSRPLPSNSLRGIECRILMHILLCEASSYNHLFLIANTQDYIASIACQKEEMYLSWGKAFFLYFCPYEVISFPLYFAIFCQSEFVFL